MAKPIDYSVWDHIEISDDEDDTHPNVDTPSLFKWRHEARLERMAKAEQDKEKFQHQYQGHHQKMSQMRQKLKQHDDTKAAEEDLAKLKLELSELEKQEEEWKKKEEEIKEKERHTPWNIDTMCRDGQSKTIINPGKPSKKQPMTDEERMGKQETFIKQYEVEVKKFGMLKRYEDSQQYLSDHPQLACEETANYLVIWCVNLEVEEKHDLMAHVAHQTIVMQFILELAKSLEMDPRSCIRGFFSRIKLADKQYTDAFNDELESFKDRVRGRAKARIEAAIQEAEEEERQQRLGPGGVDPVEVFETLPKEMQECFESKDISMLQDILLKMKKEDAEYHMKRCVDSGLWVPNAKDVEGAKDDNNDGSSSGEYEDVPESLDDVK